jgi:hypothetical protein
LARRSAAAASAPSNVRKDAIGVVSVIAWADANHPSHSGP